MRDFQLPPKSAVLSGNQAGERCCRVYTMKVLSDIVYSTTFFDDFRMESGFRGIRVMAGGWGNSV